MFEEFLLCLVSKKTKCKLPERHQVVFAEKVSQSLGDLVGRIDIAVEHPATELLRGRVDQLNLVCFAEHPIRHAFANWHSGDLFDRVGDAFEMLDVYRGDDVNSCIEKFHEILPTLFIVA